MFLKHVVLMGLIAVLSVFSCAVFAAPDIIPFPKEYKEAGGKISVSGLDIFIEKGNRQCEIAAEELTSHITELKGTAGKTSAIGRNINSPGIYVATISSDEGKKLAGKYNITITASNPGTQGYIVQAADNRIIVIGSDSIGALYGAMTLRQMMESEDGKVVVTNSYVKDWPDIKYRSSLSYLRGVQLFAFSEKTPEEKMKACKKVADTMLHFKMNIIFDYTYSRTNLWDFPEEWLNEVGEFNKYAAERGIISTRYDSTACVHCHKDKLTDELKNWSCIKEGRYGKMSFSCWSNDKLNIEKITRTAELYKKANLKMCLIHPVDGGAIEDPEQWSHRCENCRKLWKDDERWKATAHQVNLWAKIFKEKAPDVILQCPVYPYSAAYAMREKFPNTTYKKWKQNSIDFWTKTNEVLDPSILTGSWMAAKWQMDKYRTCWKNRPMTFCGHFPNYAGVFSTFNRFAVSNYYGNPMDMFFSRGTEVYAGMFTLINATEFGWNTLAPGNEQFKGLFYDPTKDHIEPKVIIDEWVPRTCRAFYGEKAGNAIAPFYQSGIQPVYISKPGYIIGRANKSRRAPLAEVDPNSVDKKSAKTVSRIAPDIIDDASLMAKQVKAAKVSLEALENTYQYYGSMSDTAKKMFIFFYRRIPILSATAKVRYATRLAGELQRDGMYTSAAAVLNTAVKELAEDEKLIKQVAEKTKGEKDIKPITDWKYGKLVALSKLKHMLSTRIADASVVLKPRRAGEFIKVGILKSNGHKGTLEYFEQFKNVKAEIIDSLNLAILDKFDCVFILKRKDINKTDFFFNVRRYVEETGGGVIIEHDLIGGERGPFGQKNPFPEICKLGEKRKDCFERKVKIITNHPALGSLKQGDTAKLMYVDYIVPVAGDNGKVLVADDMDEAVVVAGEVGFGKVIFSGTVSVSSYDGGYSAEDIKLYGLNAELAKGLVEWSTGVKLEVK